MRAPLLVSLFALPLAVAQTHLDFRRDAQAAYQRKDYPAAIAATQRALSLRPDSPRYLHNLAALSSLSGDQRAALDYLRRLAALGVVTNVERDPDFAALQGTPEFRQVLALFSANAEPRGEAVVIAELPGRTGLIEGIAARDRTRDLFLGDVHHRCIWRRERGGQLVRFTAEDDELLGIFGLAIDEPRNALWAAMTALPEMSGFEPEMKGQAGLAEFDLNTGELRRVVPAPADGREHGLGDVAVAPDGTVYATDSKAPVIWQLAVDAEEFQKAADSPAFSSLQGLVVERGSLLVADYSHGLLRVDLATGNVVALQPPENTTLLGIDGIVAIPGGIVAIQNGVAPQRVLHIALAPEGDRISTVKVLASALPNLTDLCLVTLSDDRPTFIAGAGWDVFDREKMMEPPAHTVRIFQTELQ